MNIISVQASVEETITCKLRHCVIIASQLKVCVIASLRHCVTIVLSVEKASKKRQKSVIVSYKLFMNFESVLVPRPVPPKTLSICTEAII